MRPIDADKLCMHFEELQPLLRGSNLELCDFVDNTIAVIMAQPTIEQPTWIPVTERLPAESGYYLVVYRDKFNGSELVSIDFYTKCTAGEWWDNDFGRTAIYWMPLPTPPKGDE